MKHKEPYEQSYQKCSGSYLIPDDYDYPLGQCHVCHQWFPLMDAALMDLHFIVATKYRLVCEVCNYHQDSHIAWEHDKRVCDGVRKHKWVIVE